jgi:hypothetical protein
MSRASGRDRLAARSEAEIMSYPLVSQENVSQGSLEHAWITVMIVIT